MVYLVYKGASIIDVRPKGWVSQGGGGGQRQMRTSAKWFLNWISKMFNLNCPTQLINKWFSISKSIIIPQHLNIFQNIAPSMQLWPSSMIELWVLVINGDAPGKKIRKRKENLRTCLINSTSVYWQAHFCDPLRPSSFKESSFIRLKKPVLLAVNN